MKLLIVESPSKCKTIESFLGPGFRVLSSYGHIRDLAKKKFYHGIDIENGFQPHFENLSEKYKQIGILKDAVKKSTVVYLASDDDREGEAIAWHLSQVLDLDTESNPRIVFREITKTAVERALQAPRTIDMNLVLSQQSRQIADKLIGFELSPILWRHISSTLNLSAGRVQSVVTRLVIDREDEIAAFQERGYYKVTGVFSGMNAHLSRHLEDETGSHEFLQLCIGATFTIGKVTEREEARHPPPPFITSTLQQEAGRKLGLTAKQTMSIAQKLYERGKITYMRTDSTCVSKAFQEQAKQFVVDKYGAKYSQPRVYGKKVKGGQDAHECIRPTHIEDLVGSDCTPIEKNLYRLIWTRTVASQMTPQQVHVKQFDIWITKNGTQCPDYFISVYETELFAGYKILYGESGPKTVAPTLEEGTVVTMEWIKAVQEFTQAKSRYTEASLVKALEEKGIGRPSTYASMVSKIQEKNYVTKCDFPAKTVPIVVLGIKKGCADIKRELGEWKSREEKGKLSPTEIGRMVTKFLMEHFDTIMDYNFTSDMEVKLDDIAQGNANWSEVVKTFYDKVHPTAVTLKGTAKTDSKRLMGKHPNTGENIWLILGPHGYCLQIGDTKKQAKYVGLAKGQTSDTLVWDDVLKLIQFPKVLGEIEGKEVMLKQGPHGFYLHWNGQNKGLGTWKGDVENLSLEEAETILREKPAWLLNEWLHEGKKIQILKGKWGPYVKHGDKNIALKGKSETDISSLKLEEVLTIISGSKEKAKPVKKKWVKKN